MLTRPQLWCVAASAVMALKLFFAWPPNLIGIDRYVAAACSIHSVFDLQRFTRGEQPNAIAFPVLLAGIAHMAPSARQIEVRAGGADTCAAEIWAGQVLSPILATLVALLLVGLPLMVAKAAELLTGTWRAGVPAAWITAAFERFTSAVNYGEFEIVLAALLFACACVGAATWLSKSSAGAAVLSAVAFVAAALLEPTVLIVVMVALPIILLTLTLSVGGQRRLSSASVRAPLALLSVSFAIGATLIGFQWAAAGQPILQKSSNVRAVAQRVGIANAQRTNGGLRTIFVAPPAPGVEVGNSQSVYSRLMATPNKLAQGFHEIASEFTASPWFWPIQSIVLAVQTGWRLGYFFFFLAVLYLSASWQIAKVNGMPAVWLVLVVPAALLLTLNATLGPGHWIGALIGILPIAVIPAHIWRGL